MSAQTVICGDALQLARQFAPAGPTVVITDPVWPNRAQHMFPGVDAFRLLRTTLKRLVGKVSHVVIQIGCTTDPRFLDAVPIHWPFWRTCWLPYACPVPRQQALIGSDVAFVFGPPRYPDGGRIAPGESRPANGKRGRGLGAHPCPRDVDHVRWLVRWFSRPGETVLDPFCGAGTTLIAAQEHHRDAVGWDIDPAFCELARQGLRQQQIFDASAGDHHG
jgi:hypothetical protein